MQSKLGTLSRKTNCTQEDNKPFYLLCWASSHHCNISWSVTDGLTLINWLASLKLTVMTDSYVIIAPSPGQCTDGLTLTNWFASLKLAVMTDSRHVIKVPSGLPACHMEYLKGPLRSENNNH